MPRLDGGAGPVIGAVRPLCGDDLAVAAGLHRRYLPHGLFPSLGERFLQRYLTTFLDTPTAVALAIDGEEGAFGFLCGTLDRSAHREHVLRNHGLALLRGGLVALVLHPPAALRFLRTRAARYSAALVRFARRGHATAPASNVASAGPAVLAHLVVAPSGRSGGAGAALVRAFEATARERGLERAELLTLPGDAGAGGFYERLGWRARDLCRDRDGVTWVRYEKLLG